MSGPWEKYQSTDEGPWAKYQDQSQPEQSFIDTVSSAAKSIMSVPGKVAQNLTPEKMSPYLPVAGALAGSALAGPGLGTAAGAGLGQIGSRMADLAYGRVKPADAGQGTNFAPREAIAPMIQTAVSGIPETTQGMALTAKVGRGLRKIGSAFSGAKEADLLKAYQKGPSTYSAPSMEEASGQFGKALENSGINTTPTLESTLDPQLTQARDTAMALGKKLQGGAPAPLPEYKPGMTEPHAVFQGNFDLGPGQSYSTYILKGNHPRAGGNFGSADLEKMGIPVVGAEGKGIGQVPDMVAKGLTAQEALQGRQAVDRIIASTPQKDKPTLLALGNLRDQFNQKLSELSPETAAASKTYADAILKRNLTKVMPVNKSGEYSKLAPYLAAAAGSAVGFGHHNTGEGALAGAGYLLGTSPLAMGAGAAALGAISPEFRRAALAAFIDKVTTK